MEDTNSFSPYSKGRHDYFQYKKLKKKEVYNKKKKGDVASRRKTREAQSVVKDLGFLSSEFFSYNVTHCV